MEMGEAPWAWRGQSGKSMERSRKCFSKEGWSELLRLSGADGEPLREWAGVGGWNGMVIIRYKKIIFAATWKADNLGFGRRVVRC